VREGCRAGAQWAKAGYSARELRLGKLKYRKQPHARKEPLEKKGVAGMDVLPVKKHFDSSGKSRAQPHHRVICKTSTFVKVNMALPIGLAARVQTQNLDGLMPGTTWQTTVPRINARR
jgi:hypothetical protein